MKMFYCVWVVVSFGFVEVGTTRHGRVFDSGCSASTLNQSYSSILVTWSSPNVGTYHRYSIEFWPVYSRRNITKATVNQTTTRYLAIGLEPYTMYKFVVRDISSKARICTVTRRTKANNLEVNRLLVFRINSTQLFATWKRVKIPEAIITYRAFMEWGSLGHPKVELVYHGNRTHVLVKKKYIPENLRFYVNVLVSHPQRQPKHVRQDDPSKPAEIIPPNLDPSLLSRGSNFISITWNSMLGHYGNVTYSVLLKSRDKRFSIVITNQRAVIRKLHQNTAYQLRVRVHNASGHVVKVSKWATFSTKDYDECLSRDNQCHPQAQCINTKGSYYCRCLEGWRGDGRDCHHKVPQREYCASIQYKGIIWPDTSIGEEAIASCPPEAYGNVTRKCKKFKRITDWDEPNYSQCVSKDIVTIHDNIQQPHADPVSNARKLARVISTTRRKYSEDIKLIVSSLDILSSKDMMTRVEEHARGDTRTEANELAMSVLNISNEILDEHVIPSWKQITKTSAASLAHKVIHSLDNIAVLLARNNGKQVYRAKTANVALSVKAIPVDDGHTDQWLSPTDDMREGHASGVYVPASVLKSQDISDDRTRYLSFVSYKTINKVLQIESNFGLTGNVLSPVVSVTLSPLHKNKFDKPVILTIKRPKDKVYGEPTCAFLNISNSSTVTWSTEGCQVGMFNETHTQCHCYHLTSFAVLMQVTRVDAATIDKDHHFALTLISYIGLCTSVLALLVVFLTFTLIRFLNQPRHVIHANLALSLAIAHVTFLFGIDKTESKVVCKALAIALHYLFLVAFSWMALEGVVLYLMLVKVFNSSISTKKTKLIFIVCGWGIPALIVGVSSAVYHDGYGTENFCWLSLDRQFIWAFVAPVLAVIIFNFMCLGLTFYIMAKIGDRCKPERKVDKLRYWVRSCCLLTCILGVTWLLGVFFVNKQTLFMAYLFSILNGFQGVVIFLLHCIGDRKIRPVYLNLFRCRSGTYGLTSGGGKPYRADIARNSSSEQKLSPEKRLVKQSTVSSLLRSQGVMQHVEEVKQLNEQNTSEHIIDRSVERTERTHSDPEIREEIAVTDSPEKASTPLLKRCKHVDVQARHV